MEKILFRKRKKEFVEDLGREVTIVKPANYFITNTTKDFHTKEGIITKEELGKVGKIKTKFNKEFSIFEPSFVDRYKRIKRLAQIIPLKDIGFIFSQTIPRKDSIVLEAGSGSGALSLFLANFVKKIYSYEIVQEHQDIVKENMKTLGINNIELKFQNIYDGIDEKNVDLICLDLPEPWKVVPHAKKALKLGGFIVSYSPSVPQVQDFVNEIMDQEEFIHLKTVEIIEREWEVDGRKVRPKSKSSIHSGFLSFCRRI